MSGVYYYIISKPYYVMFDCPHCGGNNMQVEFEEVEFNTEVWDDGALVECPECGENVELDNYEYS